MRISDLKNDVRSFVFEYNGTEVKLQYKPSAWTPQVEDELRNSETSDKMLEVLSEVISTWDVTEDDGQIFEPSPENLRTLPSAFVVTLIQKIWEDMAPGEVQGSFAGSSRRRG